ncbi:MAG: MFS transporter, partial [Pseudonocardia sp.]
MARSGSSQPRRGGRRRWVTVDGRPARAGRPDDAQDASGVAAPGPAAIDTDGSVPPSPNEPRRRYPWQDDPHYDPTVHRRVPPPPPQSPPPRPQAAPPPPPRSGSDPPRVAADPQPGLRMPRKLTVTRVAALRGRQFAENGVRAFRRAATADGADRSGLTALTYATMMTYAVDAAVAVALANTLFFAAATAESKANV